MGLTYFGFQGKLSELDDPDAVLTVELIKANLKTSANSEEISTLSREEALTFVD